MSTSPGWYPDPAPESVPGSVRWWDGQRWTEQTQRGPGQQPTQGQQQVQLTKPTGYQAQPVPAGYQGATGYQGPVAAPVPPVPLTHTPDGQAIANPWKRLGAQVIDALIMFVDHHRGRAVLLRGLRRAPARCSSAPAAPATTASGAATAGVTAGMFLGILLFVVGLLAFQYWYFIHRVRKVGATFGKQVLGLRIRTFHTDGQLTWGQVWGRFGLVQLASSFTGGLLGLVDALWLLWDKHCQTLHDKTVGTIVVDTSVPRVPLDHPAVQYARAFPAPRGWVADGPNPQTPATYPR